MSLIHTLHELRAELAATQEQLRVALAEKDRLTAMMQHLNFLDNALDGYIFTNERGDLHYINRYLLEQLGYQADDRYLLLGQPLPAQHWGMVEEWELLLHDLVHFGAVHERKLEMRTLDGTPLLVRVTAVPTLDGAHQFIGAQFTLRLLPYTTRQTTTELRAENRELGAISAIGRNVLSTMDTGEVVQHLLHTVRALFNIEFAWIYLREKGQEPRLAASAGLNLAEQRRVQSQAGALFDLLTRVERGQPQLFGRTEPLPPHTPARAIGMTNLALTPLVTQEETIGLLAIASRSSRFIFPSDLPSLQRIAQYAALALSNVMLHRDLERAYQELQHAQEQLVEAERQKVVVEMAGAAAHELNQPLTVLLGHSNLLARNLASDDPHRSTLEAIERNTRKISEIVARLGKITTYRTREYIEGEPIVDIDAAASHE